MLGFLKDHLGQLSSKRLVAITFGLASLVLIFIFPTHANFDFALGSMLSFAASALGMTSYEKTNSKPNDAIV
jgi:predicted membrane metal-binding protein